MTYEQLAEAARYNDAVSEEVGLAGFLAKVDDGDAILKFAERRATLATLRLMRHLSAADLPREISHVDLSPAEDEFRARMAAGILDGLCVMYRAREISDGGD